MLWTLLHGICGSCGRFSCCGDEAVVAAMGTLKVMAVSRVWLLW